MRRTIPFLVSTLLSCSAPVAPAVEGGPLPRSPASAASATSRSSLVAAPLSASAPATSGSSGAPASTTALRQNPEVRSEWPCAGCLTRLPAQKDATSAAPLLVVLHGDDGNTAWMDWTWHRATDRAGVILVVLRCPWGGGYGDPSWMRWYRSSSHNPAWLSARINEVAQQAKVDGRRLYATGYSSGAFYLSHHLVDQPGQFAAVSLVGGAAKLSADCPSAKSAVHLLIGTADPTLQSEAVPFRDWLGHCGFRELVWDVRERTTHEGILSVLEQGEAERLVQWMLGHQRDDRH